LFVIPGLAHFSATKSSGWLQDWLRPIVGSIRWAIIAAVLGGERDPYKLANLADYRVKASREEVARGMEGNWRAEVAFERQQAVDSYHFAHRQIQECDEKLALYLVSLPTRILGIPAQPEDAPESGDAEEKKGEEATKL
jgi:hypothetical protein